MKYSIVMASYLGAYPSASHNRDQKIIRAVNSVINQTFTDFELNIVADGCQATVDICKQFTDSRINVFLIPKGALFSGAPRNKGIEEARGEYIVYLDIDDVYGKNHLAIIDRNINGDDWVWYNDIRYNPRLKIWYENECEIRTVGRHGTSNICHRTALEVKWEFKGYAHDHYFVQRLLDHKNFKKIESPEYYVCHIPGTQSSGGYDL